MKLKIIRECLKITIQRVPWDALILFIVAVVLACLPGIILCSYKALLDSVSQTPSFYWNKGLVLIFAYCFFCFMQQAVEKFYHHYYLNYHSLLKFEEEMKIVFFQICAQLSLEHYLAPEVVNQRSRAQDASINIFRVYQIVIEIAALFLGLSIIGKVLLKIHPVLIVFLVCVVGAQLAERGHRIVQNKLLLYRNTQEQKEADTYWEYLTTGKKVKEIKTAGCFAFIFSKWQEVFQTLKSFELATHQKVSRVSASLNFLRLACTLGAYGMVTKLYIYREISLQEFALIIMSFNQLTFLLQEVLNLCGYLSHFTILVEPFFIFATLAKQNKKETSPLEGEAVLVLKNVSYKYPGAKTYALENIDLALGAGDSLVIVGANGSGKSTLGKIILGLLPPTKGERRVKSGAECAYLAQEIRCYAISIKNNVAFGKDVENKMLQKELNRLGLNKLGGSLETLYGQEFGGITLSGGEEQKLALLRCKIKQGDLLVFDEPTSAADPLQESNLFTNLYGYTRGKTAIIISHRLALAKNAPRILVLERGKVAEDGSFATLLAAKGVFATMWQAQAVLYGCDRSDSS